MANIRRFDPALLEQRQLKYQQEPVLNISQVPDGVRDAVLEAARKAVLAGARAPLTWVQQAPRQEANRPAGILFIDAKGNRNYTVAVDELGGKLMEEEMNFFRTPVRLSEAKKRAEPDDNKLVPLAKEALSLMVRGVTYDPENGVLSKQHIPGRAGAPEDEAVLRRIYDRLATVMFALGWQIGEFDPQDFQLSANASNASGWYSRVKGNNSGWYYNSTFNPIRTGKRFGKYVKGVVRGQILALNDQPLEALAVRTAEEAEAGRISPQEGFGIEARIREKINLPTGQIFTPPGQTPPPAPPAPPPVVSPAAAAAAGVAPEVTTQARRPGTEAAAPAAPAASEEEDLKKLNVTQLRTLLREVTGQNAARSALKGDLIQTIIAAQASKAPTAAAAPRVTAAEERTLFDLD